MSVQRYIWKTAQIIQETPDAITIVFDTKGQPFEYHPGQFINLILDINGERVVRSYSLSSTPGLDRHPAISLKRVPGGLASNYLFEQCHSITSWQVEGPFGSFTLPDTSTSDQHLVFIAGGSGITPIYSMIRSALQNQSHQIRLFYSNRTPKDALFFDALNSLSLQHTGRLHLQHILTGESDPAEMNSISFLKGRLSRLVIRKMLAGYKASNAARFYLCGPEGLIQTGNEALLSLGIPEENIRLEYFTPPDKEDQTALPDRPMEVQVHFYEQTNLIDVDPGQTILEAALKDRIPLPYSCKTGTCGVCTAKLTEGTVHMRQNYALDNTRLKEGYILLCQSHPLDEAVTVEIG